MAKVPVGSVAKAPGGSVAKAPIGSVKEDRWIPSACSMCYSHCSIKGHVVDGTLVKIEGNPDSPMGSGKMCAKGQSGIMMLYDPNRLNKPLKRTNPEKGIGVDPKWVEISWDEALDIVCEKLKKCHDEEPRGLMVQATAASTTVLQVCLFIISSSFGTPNVYLGGGGLHCGNGAHEFSGLMHSSWGIVPDWKNCNFAMLFGASKGHAAGHAGNANAQLAAEARARGMKLVVVDPMCNFASGKASEWVPIRVGTDAALALGMANVLVNELGIYDRAYLKKSTNAPYLVKEDGHYLRDESSGKPLVWDAAESCAKTYDDATVKDFAIEGSYTVDGVKAQPGFQILKEHLKKYTPEYAAKITTLPQATIRRLAKEFGEAARIGSTIVLDGLEVPYRPAAAVFFRGAQGHVNSTYNCVAVDLLNHICGTGDAAGGCLGFNPVSQGYPGTGRPSYAPSVGPDGLMVVGAWLVPHKPYPPHEAAPPKSMGLVEAFPMAHLSAFLVSEDREKWWEKFKLPYRPKVLLNAGANTIMSVANKEVHAEILKKFEFIISFDIFLNETTAFADVVLPDTCYLERLESNPQYPLLFSNPPGMEPWGWAIRQPMVNPVPERRDFLEMLYKIAYRIGLREPINIATNVYFDLHGKYKLDPQVEYTYADVTDHVLRDKFGDEHGVEWFKEHGVITWPKKPEEAYWRHLSPVRVPIYYEFFKTVGEQVRKLAREYGLEDDVKYFAYEPVPDWHPCPSHEEKDPSFDLYSFYYRDIIHTNSLTMQNAWLDEAARMDPYTYNLTINADTAKRKGLKDGDWVWVENKRGRKIKGRVRLSEGIHPEGLGVAALCGHWSDDQPLAKGKGVFYNELLEIDYEHMDPANHTLDICAKVKLTKAY